MLFRKGDPSGFGKPARTALVRINKGWLGCECITSRLAEPMRKYCRKLMESVGIWETLGSQEKPLDVNAALVRWLAAPVADYWPAPPA